MTTVLTYGTFDLFHIGHVRLLERLAALGDRLIVGLSTDEFNRLKGKTAIFSYDQRREILLGSRYVDQVVPEESWAQKRQDIRRYRADIFAMGDDWAGKFDDLADLCQVIYLARTSGISTTEVRQTVLRRAAG
jgi:glycerol-3-phosphate cytidylyltransferase